MLTILYVSGVIGLAAGASVQTAETAAAPPVKEVKICRRSLQNTGSMIRVRVCRTKAQWAEIDRFNADDLEQATNRKGAVRAEPPPPGH